MKAQNETLARPRLLRVSDVCAMLGVSRTSLYRWMDAGQFPRPVKLGHVSAFPEQEIAEWIERRVQARDTGGEVQA